MSNWGRDKRPTHKPTKVENPNGPGAYEDVKSWLKTH